MTMYNLSVELDGSLSKVHCMPRFLTGGQNTIDQMWRARKFTKKMSKEDNIIAKHMLN